ncbi:MAG: hypothetical protein HY906_20325 [Deltaproteobacteria bacterium]|nr:hypothetical protein [Deltaproteobacteria bacterium]
MRRLVPLLLLAVAAPALGYDWELQSETVGQGYQVRRLQGGGQAELLSRRRLTQDLGLGVYNLAPEGWTDEGRKNQLYVVTRLKFDTDFGTYPEKAARDLIPELQRYDFTLLYGFVGGRDVFGRVDFQLGRQISMDLMDFYSFDGLLVRVRAPGHLALEALGGAAVRNEWPLASPIFELDGTSRHNRDPQTRPGLEDSPAATVGAALETWGLGQFQTRLAYRATISATRGRLEGEPATALLDERLSWQAAASLWRGLVQPMAGVRWDFLQSRVDQAEAALRVRPWRRHSFVVEYLRAAPTFDGDSIFNVFATEPYQDLRAGWDFDGPGLQAYLRGFTRFFAAAGGVGGGTDAGGAAGLTLRFGRGRARADVYYEDGYAGRRTGCDLRAAVEVVRGWLALDGRTTVVATATPSARENRIGEPAAVSSVGLEGGVRWTPARALTVHVVSYGNLSSLERSFGVFTFVEIHAWLFETHRKGQR